jgi:hypothetical protein
VGDSIGVAQVSASGGDPASVPTPFKEDHWLYNVSPDGSEFLLANSWPLDDGPLWIMPTGGARFGDLAMQMDTTQHRGASGKASADPCAGTSELGSKLDLGYTAPNSGAISSARWLLTLNNSAEFGNSAGAITNLVTKSGTNQLHGSGWEFLRNDLFDANPFFANHSPDPADRKKSPLRLNQFGATLGGPLKRTSFSSLVHIRETGS